MTLLKVHPLLDGIFAVPVFPDGVRADDLCAAIQAAWLAGDRELAKELANRYGVYNQLCLRCASRWISAATPPLTQAQSWVFDGWIYQLCEACRWYELNPRTHVAAVQK